MVLRKMLFVAILLAASFVVNAKTDKYRMVFGKSSASEVTIGWNQVSGDDAVLYYGTKDYSTNWKKYKGRRKVDHKNQYGVLSNNFVRLKKLRPDTKYYFVIKDSDSISKRFWFKTASDKPKPFTFVAGGDSRNNPKARREGNMLVAKLRPLFVLFGADYTGGGSDKEWVNWLDDWQLTITEDGRIIPIVPTHGNHENRDMQMVYKIFDTPHPDAYYSLKFGGNLMRVWALNTELSALGSKYKTQWEAQNSWFEKDLEKSKNIKWKVVAYHRPMRPHTKLKSEGTQFIKAWADLFYKHKVDLAIEADTHMVKRTYPLRPSTEKGSYESFIRDDKNGTVFIGEGGWGAPRKPANDDKPWTMACDSFFQFKWLHVNSKNIVSRVVKFENVDKIKPLTEKNLFEIPENLSIWEPESGALLTLPFKK